MKFYRVWVDCPDSAYSHFDLYGCMTEEAVENFFSACDSYEEVNLPNHEMRFTPLFELCAGVYEISKGKFGKWEPEDFEGVEINASMAV